MYGNVFAYLQAAYKASKIGKIKDKKKNEVYKKKVQ